ERVGDAAVLAGEEAHLRFPASPVAAVLVHEQDRRAGAGLFVVELHAVGHGRVRHRMLLRLVQAPKRSSRSSTVGILSSLTLAKASRTKRPWPAPNISPGMV